MQNEMADWQSCTELTHLQIPLNELFNKRGAGSGGKGVCSHVVDALLVALGPVDILLQADHVVSAL